MKRPPIHFILLLFLPIALFAQKIDNMASFRDIKSDRYFRFSYDNDYFSSTDQNYTQDYNFELVLPILKKNPLNHIFLKVGNKVKYGLSVEHIGYTPSNIKSSLVQFGDRPFAAAIMLKSFSIATDTLRNTRFISSFNIGIMGPGAFGKEMQVAIHEATGNTIPQGWQNQIRNDAVLNYELSHERQLFRYRNLLALQSNTTLRLGTLFTNASVGFNAVFGIINTPFTPVKKSKKFALYAYSQPVLNVIGYDATLQGGLFNNASPYTIASGEIERFTGQHNYGIILQTRTLYFEYSRVTITREFTDGHAAKWGGIKVGFTF